MPTDDDILRLFLRTGSDSDNSADASGPSFQDLGLPRAARRRLLDAALGVTSASRTFIAVLEDVLLEQRARLDDLGGDAAESRPTAPPRGVDVPVVFGSPDPRSDG